MCQKKPPLVNCCCAIGLGRTWRKLLPEQVRGAIASMDLKTQFDQTGQAADAVFKAIQQTTPAVASVRPSTATPATAGNYNDFESFQTHINAEMAAFRGGRRGQARGGGGQQRGQSAARFPRQNPQTRTTRPPMARKPSPHTDGPPDTHWNFGRQAYKCGAPDTCPWKSHIKPRPQ